MLGQACCSGLRRVVMSDLERVATGIERTKDQETVGTNPL